MAVDKSFVDELRMKHQHPDDDGEEIDEHGHPGMLSVQHLYFVLDGVLRKRRLPLSPSAYAVVTNAVRRSKRRKINTLQYWKNERVLLERRRSGVYRFLYSRLPHPRS